MAKLPWPIMSKDAGEVRLNNGNSGKALVVDPDECNLREEEENNARHRGCG